MWTGVSAPTVEACSLEWGHHPNACRRRRASAPSPASCLPSQVCVVTKSTGKSHLTMGLPDCVALVGVPEATGDEALGPAAPQTSGFRVTSVPSAPLAHFCPQLNEREEMQCWSSSSSLTGKSTRQPSDFERHVNGQCSFSPLPPRPTPSPLPLCRLTLQGGIFGGNEGGESQLSLGAHRIHDGLPLKDAII